jgi:hypothetical protein
MRIRTIKPEFWQHRMHKRLSVSASLLAAALLDYADDEGRFEAEGERIRGILVPSIKLGSGVRELLEELAALDWVALYAVNFEGIEVEVGQICAFELHQVIQRPKPSLLPGPPAPWERVVVFPEERSVKNGKVVVTAAKGKWVRCYPHGAQGGSSMNRVCVTINDASLTETNTVAGVVNDESLGKGMKEGKGKEGTEGRELASATPPARYDSDADLPGVEELVAFGETLVPTAAPRDYAERLHSEWSADHWWVKNGRLRDWRHHFRNWWAADALTWGKGAHRWQRLPGGGTGKSGENKNGGGAPGTSLPTWRQVEELKRAILEHPANRRGESYQPRCSSVQRAGLAELERQLAALEKGPGVLHSAP